jgi:acetylornithine deacetylase/succinyl-diaminopimelate desuccinylase-like protein
MSTPVAIDRSWLEETLLALLRTPSSVPAGATEVEPGDPAIVRAVEDVVLPLIEALQPDEIRRHPSGDVAARFGPDREDGLLLQTYIVSQHGNLMDDPHAGQIVDGASLGLSGPTAVGQGANQNKGPMASALTALRQVPRDLSRPVWLAVNTEGKSSHGGSRRIIDDLGVRAAWGIVSIGTDLGVSIGNRGRVDVVVTVPGASCHSSQPWLGSNPIEGAADVVTALRTAPLPQPHDHLGPSSATPYQVAVHPVAPHTIPSEARVVVDRRVLPGEEVATAVRQLKEHLQASVDADIEVREGVSMLPAAVAEDAPVVEALRSSVQAAGRPSPAFWSLNTFDAGYACAKGIPTCMFGPGKRSFAKGVTAAEAVTIEDCSIAAAALHDTVVALCS